MGIINVTPDSFSQDGCLKNSRDFVKKAIALASRHVREGADILDVGGESSRPGARRISAQEEIDRVIPVIHHLSKRFFLPISIDTYKASVAHEALNAGATIVNNIRGTDGDEKLLKVVKELDAAIILMHIRGTPRTMQKNIYYKDLIGEVVFSLQKSLEKCLEIGIKSDKIIIDPGIGFGKSADHNLEILNRLDELKLLHRPLMIGTSRKSFIGEVLDTDVNQRLYGTLATVCASILKGAHIVRVHDVKPTKEVALMADAILHQSSAPE
jgi:dihydropteroate synthase